MKELRELKQEVKPIRRCLEEMLVLLRRREGTQKARRRIRERKRKV